jgi:putative ATP-binding cassette transporter
MDLLPVIRAEGRTVVAITHDDAYFHLADRRIHVAGGMVTL